MSVRLADGASTDGLRKRSRLAKPPKATERMPRAKISLNRRTMLTCQSRPWMPPEAMHHHTRPPRTARHPSPNSRSCTSPPSRHGKTLPSIRILCTLILICRLTAGVRSQCSRPHTTTSHPAVPPHSMRPTPSQEGSPLMPASNGSPTTHTPTSQEQKTTLPSGHVQLHPPAIAK